MLAFSIEVCYYEHSRGGKGFRGDMEVVGAEAHVLAGRVRGVVIDSDTSCYPC